MKLTSKLSSQVGDKSEESNRNVAAMCLRNPDLLGDIADGLQSDDGAMVGDSAEVMTIVAEVHPELIIPWAEYLPPLLDHPRARVRWESMHALGLIASLVPDFIETKLNRIGDIINNDSSVIARDWAVRTVSEYAGTGQDAAKKAYPLLKDAVAIRQNRHAHHAFPGMEKVAEYFPRKRREIESIAEEFTDSKRGVLKKAARQLLKRIDSLEG
jgi:hypothetical protein